MVDIPNNSTTTAKVSVGGSLTGTIDTGGDHDWIAVQLVAGQKYTITLEGTGSNPLEDPFVYIRDASGTELAKNDDGNGTRNSRVVFTPETSGTYYIDASAWDDDQGTYKYTGDYKVSVAKFTPPPAFDFDQIADQLVNGYWGGDFHHFNVTQGGTITVNITALTGAGQTLARAALQEWSDIIGVNFTEVSTGGQITFDDSDEGAYTTASYSNHITTSAAVNISTDWLADYGTSLNSYSFQSYLHEIGHALGLGHAGGYNETATYPDDAVFSNDAWSTTIMSYFSPRESTFFRDKGFSYDFALTPMNGDILAVQTLYGLSTTTRTGDTTYGYGSTAGAVYNTTVNPDAAYTIFDNGGIDTLNYASSNADQLINLNPETFSNVAGETGNVSIARGTVIENVNTGSGDDTIIGNGADNVINAGAGRDSVDGGGGNDTISYATFASAVTVNLGTAAAQNTGGAGTDTLISIENAIGTSKADSLSGSSAANDLVGGAGDDMLKGLAGNDTLDGGAGSDKMYGGTGDDVYLIDNATDYAYEYAGEGTDTVIASVSASLRANVENLTLAGTASITGKGNELANEIDGNAGANRLSGLAGDDMLIGGGGRDILDGGTGNDTLKGGGDNDIYVIDSTSDVIVENAGEGVDFVQTSASFTLSANVDRMYLLGSGNIDSTLR